MKRAACILLCAAACGPAAPPAARGTDQPNKADLYGDPGLVPSREGERARRELALAGEIAAALRELHAVETVFVTVTERESTRVAVTGTTTADGDATRLNEDTERIAVSVVGADVIVEAAWTVGAPSDVPSPARPVLWLALLALGASAGITLDRARRRR